jgi:hypothetical protein
MTSGGMRATSLSAVTKLGAGQTLSSYHCARHWLYCLLATGLFFIQIQTIYFFKFKKIFPTFVRLFPINYTTNGKALDKIIG